jgi:uncharacterized membrane protein YjjP (DUF1212 family)
MFKDVSTPSQRGIQSSSPRVDRILCCALDVAQLTLKCGGEIQRVEETVTRICRAYGAAHVEVFAIHSWLNAALRMPDGSYSMQMRRIYHTYNDLGQLEGCNELSRRICRETPDFDEIQTELSRLKAARGYPLWLVLLGAALTSGAFTIFFDGTLTDGICAAIIGALLGLLDRRGFRFANQMARTLLCALLGGLLSYAAVRIGLDVHADKVMIGTIMLIIPGLALGTSLRDLLCDDTLSGILRLFRSLLLAVVIALGYSGGIYLLGNTGLLSYSFNTPWLMLLTSALSPVGMAIMFGVRPSRLPLIAFGGFMTCGVYVLMCEVFTGQFFPNLIATAALALCCELAARLLHLPATVLCIPSLMPLLPGGALYYAMNDLLLGEFDAASKCGITAATIALGIAAGQITVSLAISAYRAIRDCRNA